jgi:AcrR family transcriptional regulator
MSTPTRWAGVPLRDRRTERRALLVDAGYTLFGAGGEAALSVRSVCRESGLNSRYFYESFAEVNDLLGAVYDTVAAGLGDAVEQAIEASADSLRDRMSAGIRAVLGFSSADPRRGRVLFTDARANPVLISRRALTQDILRDIVLLESGQSHSDSHPIATRVGASMYTGAMAELAQDWLAGNLGDDLDAVVSHAVRLVLKAIRP